MRTRDVFGYWMTNQGFKEAAEIGCQQGEFSDKILSTWQGNLVMIDSWEQDSFYAEAQKIIEKFPKRSKLLKTRSSEASELFPDNHFDLIYINNIFSYSLLKKEIEIWIDKIKKGGAISGGNYLDGHISEGLFGVRSAVRDYFGKEPNIITSEPFPTWVIYL